MESVNTLVFTHVFQIWWTSSPNLYIFTFPNLLDIKRTTVPAENFIKNLFFIIKF